MVSFENIPDDEPTIIHEISKNMLFQLQKYYVHGDGVVRRDTHAKGHGAVRAEFVVNDNIAQNFRVGVFSEPGKKYKAWMRFSNNSGYLQNDVKKDGRGLAIKLMGVEGEKILENEKFEKTQDFIFITHPVFFIKNAKDYLEFTSVPPQKVITWFFPKLRNKFHFHWRELLNGLRINNRNVSSPLEAQYWSTTPYLFGDNRAVKYSVRPRGDYSVSEYNKKEPNYLRKVMGQQLIEANVEFDFMIQLWKPGMSIEDPTLNWDEKISPFIPVAKIIIPKQVFDTEEQLMFAENLSFTPWHSLPEHRPLGSINRIRKITYETISQFRHEKNEKKRTEPEPW